MRSTLTAPVPLLTLTRTHLFNFAWIIISLEISPDPIWPDNVQIPLKEALGGPVHRKAVPRRKAGTRAGFHTPF